MSCQDHGIVIPLTAIHLALRHWRSRADGAGGLILLLGVHEFSAQKKNSSRAEKLLTVQ